MSPDGNQVSNMHKKLIMKSIVVFLFGIIFLSTQCSNREKKPEATSAEAETWVWLFSGSSTDHWRDIKSEAFPEHGWEVEDGILTVFGEKEGQAGGHDIITKDVYGNFELELEVRITEGANSGVKYQVQG